jgi:glucosamine 6-phosphate synthetase-like amidotransferase/phosphosugar isomerase protein
MCGIAGVSNLNSQTSIALGYLAYSMENRGGDSWGITNGTHTVRAVGPISSKFEIPEQFQFGNIVSLHTRAASVGEVSEINQHPFYMEGPNKIVLVCQWVCIKLQRTRGPER